ncbi:unnamed protein product, partial [Rotaria magnacalcarata]
MVWTQGDIQQWTDKLREEKRSDQEYLDWDRDYLPKMMTIAVRAIELYCGYHPRNIQLIVSAIVLESHTIAKALISKRVDIVTSSEILAMRDAKTGVAKRKCIFTEVESGSLNSRINVSAGVLASSEIFDSSVNQWKATGSMATPREYHTATLLNSDKVIVIGGEGFAGYMTSCEIYDPSTGQWDVIASMKTARADHAAILLGSGKVLVAGGRGYSESLINCEIYDPLTSKWHPTANMSIARPHLTATVLNSGKVLVTGSVASSELYDPVTGHWQTPTRMATARSGHSATLL